jgi:hypothetical protein
MSVPAGAVFADQRVYLASPRVELGIAQRRIPPNRLATAEA